jgi:hypothetical protein
LPDLKAQTPFLAVTTRSDPIAENELEKYNTKRSPLLFALYVTFHNHLPSFIFTVLNVFHYSVFIHA